MCGRPWWSWNYTGHGSPGAWILVRILVTCTRMYLWWFRAYIIFITLDLFMAKLLGRKRIMQLSNYTKFSHIALAFNYYTGRDCVEISFISNLLNNFVPIKTFLSNVEALLLRMPCRCRISARCHKWLSNAVIKLGYNGGIAIRMPKPCVVNVLSTKA